MERKDRDKKSLHGRNTMNRRMIILLLSCAFLGWSEAVPAIDFNVQTGTNLEWWKDDDGHKARQFYTPLKMEAREKNFSLSLLTGYAYTRIDGIPEFVPPSFLLEDTHRSQNHLLDTKANFSYEILGKLPVDILFGLDFNLPTGKTNLKEKDLVLLMDPDLVSITNFGEGFNVNPTLSIAKEWGKWVTGISFGYLWRGEYDFGFLAENPFFSQRLKDFDPGDLFNLNAEAGYDFLPGWHGRLFGGYTWYGKDRWTQQTIFTGSFSSSTRVHHQEGNLLTLGLGLQYSQPRWNAGFTLRSLFRDKSKFDAPIAFGGVRLTTEDENSHGDEWIGDLSFSYVLDDKTTLTSFLQGLLIAKNDDTFFTGTGFIRRREKISLGFGATRKLCHSIEAGLNIKGFLMRDEFEVSSFVPFRAFFPPVHG